MAEPALKAETRTDTGRRRLMRMREAGRIPKGRRQGTGFASYGFRTETAVRAVPEVIFRFLRPREIVDPGGQAVKIEMRHGVPIGT